MFTVLILDVDNTLYDFVDYYAPSFRSMIGALALETGVAESDIKRSARAVYRRAGCLEYKFLIQNMDIFQNCQKEEQLRLIRVARRSFRGVKRARFQLYDGVRELLIVARKHGCKCVCVSNAPIAGVYGRLRELKLLTYVNGLLAWQGYDLNGAFLEHRLETQRVDQSLTRLELFSVLSVDQLKPSTYPFELIKTHYGASSRYIAVGDSVSRDLDPAKSLGMTTVWAKYGTSYKPENFETLVEITPWTKGQVREFKQLAMRDPDHVALTPREIAPLIEPSLLSCASARLQVDESVT
jgi:FMN phosphatase YigB (HAD superfamily)